MGRCGGPEKDQGFGVSPIRTVLVPLPSNAACQLYVFQHDHDPPGMDGTKVGVLKEAH